MDTGQSTEENRTNDEKKNEKRIYVCITRAENSRMVDIEINA